MTPTALRAAAAVGAAALLAACAPRARIELGPDGIWDVGPDGRRAAIRLPHGRAPAPGGPLVLVLHGYTADGPRAAAYLGLADVADETGAVLVLPDGTRDAAGHLAWRPGPGDVADVDALLALVDRVAARFGTSPAQTYVVGQSNGGSMVHRLACAAPARFAAAASVAGARIAGPCTAGAPLALLEVHGTADASVAYQGGWFARATAPVAYLGAEEALTDWADRQGCAPVPSRTVVALHLLAGAATATRVTRWTGCPAGSAAELWTLEGAGHAPRFAPTFARALFAFFAAHARAGKDEPALTSPSAGSP